MISFTLLTDTPARLRARLLERGIIEQTTNRAGQTVYVGTRHGVEFVEVPNPIVVTPAVGEPYIPNPDYVPAVGEPFIIEDGERVPNPDYVPAQGTMFLGRNPDYVPPVMDTRRVYLVKVAHEAEADETDGLEQDDIDPETGRPTRRSVLLRTKLGQWVMENSTPDTITSADGRSWQARNINDNFWLTISDDFGVWQ